MKPEDHAWRSLQQHAASQLRNGFADRVVRAANGPTAETWRALRAQGAAQLRPGFAERVLRAARILPGVPSFGDQLVLSVGTAAACAIALFLFDARNAEIEDERNLAVWQQIARVSVENEPGL